MKKKEILRGYNFSDAKLVTIGKEKIAFMRRDKTEFENLGLLPMILMLSRLALMLFLILTPILN
ncbi:hypothetical protein [Flavobacterium sp.]|uniref:hypothetical protein n=1 Tax=Flavobacterium sp. TaxID=239 RepID=UPI0025D9159D|nr:hypothetical protein [Flavobacterium sp.]